MPTTITFSEFSIGTVNPTFTLPGNSVTTVGGIRSDSANPTSPVLAGSANSFFPPISVSFEIPVDSVTVDAGYFDNSGSTRILFYGPDGAPLSIQFNSTGDGIETFTYTATDVPIAGFSVVALGIEDAGFAIDNLIVGDPVSLELPDLQTGVGDAASLEVWLDDITNAIRSSHTDTLGPGDGNDVYGFFAPHPVRVTFAVTAESNPNTVVEYEIDYGTGTHFFSMVDTGGYSKDETYTVSVVSVLDTSNAQRAAAQQAGLDLAQNLLKLTQVDMPDLAAQINAAVATADDAAEFYKGLSKGLGKAAIFLDVFFRIDNVYNAQNPARELFIQAVDFGTGLLASWGGAAGGAAIGAWFAGVGAGIGGPLGGFGAGIIYNFGISNSVQAAAGDFWDANIGIGNKLAPFTEEAFIVFNAEEGAIEIHAADAVQMITAEAFDPEFYLDTYPDAAAAIAEGQMPSAYLHFLLEGAALGYLPSAGAQPVDPADLVGNDSDALQALANADTRWGIYQGLESGDIRGDGVSQWEQAFYDAIVVERTDGFAFDLDAGLTTVANRRAIDLVHNLGADPAFLAAVGGADWGAADWANGVAFEDAVRDVMGYGSFVDINVYAFVSNSTDPVDLIQELSATLRGRDVLYNTDFHSVGIAEYGGVWVVIVSTDFSNGAPVAEDHDILIDRRGAGLNDAMALGTWEGQLDGARGSDTLEGGVGDDTLLGGRGDDSLNGSDGADSIGGNSGSDMAEGGDGNDSLIGGIGFDTLLGDDGDDVLEGNDGYDVIDGGAGNDYLIGNNGFDLLIGGLGDDTALGGLGLDTLLGGEGVDVLSGQAGFDSIDGGDGNDLLNGNAGADTVIGGAGNDVLAGGINNDLLLGGLGADTLNGNNGADDLRGEAGVDILSGNAGSDTLNGGSGNDVLRGGIGVDTFVFEQGSGADTIVDFQNGIDVIQLDAALMAQASPVPDDLRALASLNGDGNLVLDFGNGDTLTFNNVGNTGAILDEVIFV